MVAKTMKSRIFSTLSIIILSFLCRGLPLISASTAAGHGVENILHPRSVRCHSKLFPRCYDRWVICPIQCPRTCSMDCDTCKPVCSCDVPGALCQDPRFVGGDGITFYFHGRKDEDFCIVSDSDFHINAHFIGKRNPSLKRDFTWVQSLGILSDSHKLFVGAEKTRKWDDTTDHLKLILDDTPLSIPTREGYKWTSPTSPAITITRTSSTNGITVEYEGKFKINAAVVPITKAESRIHGYDIGEDDCFAHLELGFKFYNLTDSIDGVLGQTYAKGYISKVKVGAVMPVMGGMDKYVSGSLFSTDCMVSRYGKAPPSPARKDEEEYGSVSCRSGMEGSGVVCK